MPDYDFLPYSQMGESTERQIPFGGMMGTMPFGGFDGFGGRPFFSPFLFNPFFFNPFFFHHFHHHFFHSPFGFGGSPFMGF